MGRAQALRASTRRQRLQHREPPGLEAARPESRPDAGPTTGEATWWATGKSSAGPRRRRAGVGTVVTGTSGAADSKAAARAGQLEHGCQRRDRRDVVDDAATPGVQLSMLARSMNSSPLMSPCAKRSARMRFASSSGADSAANRGRVRMPRRHSNQDPRARRTTSSSTPPNNGRIGNEASATACGPWDLSNGTRGFIISLYDRGLRRSPAR